jgi:hypothetical protein
LFSQSISYNGRGSRNNYINYGQLINAKELNKPYYESVTGSPFLNDTYLPVRLNNYQTVVSARYDAYKDIFEIKNAKKTFHFTKNIGNKVIFANDNLKYQVFQNKDNSKSFYKVNFEQKNSFILIKETVNLYGGEKPENTYDEYIHPYFKRINDKTYISLDSNDALIIPSSNKKFLKLFEENKNEVKNYIKSNKLSHKKVNDLKKILIFYNTL